MPAFDPSLLKLTYFAEGETLYICGGHGYPLPDSHLPTIATYRQKLINLASRWGCAQATLIGDTQQLDLKEETMPDLIAGNNLIITSDLHNLTKSWLDAGDQNKYGIVRLYDKVNPKGLEEAQLCLSINNDDLIWSPSTAVGKSRSDYVHPADLEELRGLYSQESQFEFTFRSTHKRPGNQTAYFTNSYQLFEDSRAVYQISRRVDLVLKG